MNNYDEMFADFEAVMEEIASEKSGIQIGDGIVFLYWRSEANPYQIELKRIPSWAALVDWILHLSEKKWMSQFRTILFTEAVIKAKNWKRVSK